MYRKYDDRCPEIIRKGFGALESFSHEKQMYA
jgi:hypothetical protein